MAKIDAPLTVHTERRDGFRNTVWDFHITGRVANNSDRPIKAVEIACRYSLSSPEGLRTMRKTIEVQVAPGRAETFSVKMRTGEAYGAPQDQRELLGQNCSVEDIREAL